MLRTVISCLEMRERQMGGPNQNDFYAKLDAGGQGTGEERGRSMGSRGGSAPGPPFASTGVSPPLPEPSPPR